MKDKEELLKLIVSACEERKAENCIVLNMENLTPIASYFLICHGNSERQVQADRPRHQRGRLGKWL